MITGRQIFVCDKAARRIEELKMEIRKVQADLEKAGLSLQASSVGCLAEHLWEESCSLERAAREAYAAAKRGEALPK